MNNLVKIENNQIVINQDFLEKYKNFKRLQLEMDLLEKEFKQELMESMESQGQKKLLQEGFSATIRDASTRTTIDSTRLKNECPEIYEAYSKTTNVASSISISVE